MDPPVKEHLDDAVQLLIEIEALTLVENNSREALTRLGTGKNCSPAFKTAHCGFVFA